MMLTINVCLVRNCFLFEKFYLHYALCDFESIFLHCTKFFIRQSIDREQIFDVTFQNTPPLKNPAYATGCTPILLYAKILKETEGTIDFFVAFLLLVSFQLGAPDLPWLRLWSESIIIAHYSLL